MFSRDRILVRIQQEIFKQNRVVEAAWRQQRDRPLVTLIYLGGRYGDSGPFARELAQTCSGKMPRPVAYVAKGALAYCDRLETAEDTERKVFLGDIQDERLSLCGADSLVGERVGLAYDATRMYLAAVQRLASDTPRSGEAWDPDRLNPMLVLTQAKALGRADEPYRGAPGGSGSTTTAS